MLGVNDYDSASLRSAESKQSGEDATSDIGEEESIKWIHIIFLPFQLWWQVLVLIAVIIKCIMGPLSAIFPILDCPKGEPDEYFFYLEFTVRYLVEPLYIIDTFLYIVHRQVTDEAMKREHLPKPGYQIILDVISLVPLYTMFSDDLCVNNQLWPNMLNFNQFLLIYRIAKFFALNSSHNFANLTVGYLTMFFVIANAVNCFFILYTFYGLCESCGNDKIYGWMDWRKSKEKMLVKSEDRNLGLYLAGFSIVSGLITNNMFDRYRPYSRVEIMLFNLLMIIGFGMIVFVLSPKLFGECLLRVQRIYKFHPRIKRIVEETQRRNPLRTAYIKVESFYTLIWNKRHGIISMPKTINELPETMRLDIRLDLVWAVFHHSPTFRRSTLSYRRWLCQHIALTYKQPGERFFSGPHCYSNLYYIKAGIVQLLSTDDTTAALLSLSGGTLLGDISFLIPPRNRKVIARCLTYCEVLTVARADIVTSLHKFPEDRRVIMALCKERLKHARDLYEKKEKIKGKDRTEDEGIAWVKHRWWQIFHAIHNLKYASSKAKSKWELPVEQTNYHCAKYIGQLVLCEDIQLQRKSLFAKVTFPWILAPLSRILQMWRRIVLVTVALVLVIFPPNIVRQKIDAPYWFQNFHNLVDIIYIADVFINLLTGKEVNKKIETNFISLLVNHCKDIYFILDVLSTPGIEYFASLTKNEEILYLIKFNRLLKIYILFVDKHERVWRKEQAPLRRVLYVVFMTQFCFIYISAYMMYLPISLFTGLDENVFYGNLCIFNNVNCSTFLRSSYGVFSILVGWVVNSILHITHPTTLVDLLVGNMFLLTKIFVNLFVRFKLVSALYLKYRESVNYQFFVTNLKDHYIRLKIHPDLLKRMDNYLDCHWRYYNGMDILHPNLLKDEPFDIYLKLHGDTAEKLIQESPAFLGADKLLIKELANKSSFLILPQNSTLVMFGVEMENVTWISSGVIKCEYHDDQGETCKTYIDKGEMLATPAVFLGRPPLRTYSSASDVEILYIKIQEFFTILRRHPIEWSYFETCKKQLGPVYEAMFNLQFQKHKDYQKTLRQRVFHARQSVANFNPLKKKLFKDLPSAPTIRIPEFLRDFTINPESKLLLYWMAFRAVIFYISLISQTLQGISLRNLYESTTSLRNVCFVFRFIDIVIKFFIPYYDERGLVISKKTLCARRYLCKGFVVDLISFVFSWPGIVKYTLSFQKESMNRFAEMIAEYLGLYLFVGYFDYMANKPSSYVIFLMIFKWQLIIVLTGFSFGGILSHYCIDRDDKGYLNDFLMPKCWMPIYSGEMNVTITNWNTIFAQSISLVQCFFMSNYLGAFDLRHQGESIIALHLVAASMFWYCTCFSETLLILAYRGDTIFQHGIFQLKSFLTGERVEKHIINKTLGYFSYWWRRTAGVDMKILMNERVGVVFRQDMCYYFFKSTFHAVDTLLHGGDVLERQLASCTSELYHLPGDDIVREMDLCTNLYIVHRGRISICKNGAQLCIVSKGAIIGQLDGPQLRPMRITARAIGRADLLVIPTQLFHQMITDDVRKHILNNPQSKLDYVSLKKNLPENPYNTIEYLLRGTKVIQLPWMDDPVTAETNKWYARWLMLVWAISSIVTAAAVILHCTFFSERTNKATILIVIMDILQAAYLYTEYYTMELIVVEARCNYRYIRWKKFKSVWIYLDVLSLLLPYTTVFFLGTVSHLARLLRLYMVVFFYRDFCGQFEGKTKATILKFVLIILLLHSLVCGWIAVACRSETFPFEYLPYHHVRHPAVDLVEWDYLFKSRKETGCLRILRKHENQTDIYGNILQVIGFIAPRYWQGDYLVALHFIIILFTNTNVDIIVPATIREIFYKIFAWHLLYLLRLWINSVVISTVYTKYREMYHFDYAVQSLLEYLKFNDISLYLRQSIRTYTDLLWQRHSGNWLPEITEQAPICLREDIFCSLYIHHLLTPLLFQNLPMYFLRQLVVRLKRVVIFPGKYVVEEGDIHPCIYFIHEGEVEKWYTDKTGESRMTAVLTINGVFGIIPGLFPNTPYRFSYYTRTVVDLVYLEYSDWQDLLNGYPDIKHELYQVAMSMKKDISTPSKTSLRSGSKTSIIKDNPI